MNRKEFLSLLGFYFLTSLVTKTMGCEMEQPKIKTELKAETFYFKDDGKIPNSKYPLMLYRNAFSERGSAGAAWLEERFAANNVVGRALCRQ
jgi:hypothetical protein